MNLENDLREALRREEAPEGFAGRVLTKTLVAPQNITIWWRRPATLALAAALLLAALIPSQVSESRRREQRRGLQARDQLMTALAITRVQLQHAKERIRRNTRHRL